MSDKQGIPESRGTQTPRLINRRRLVLVGLTSIVGSLAGGWWVGRERQPSPQAQEHPSARTTRPRIVSLSPGVTETIEHLQAGALLVGISDYCRPTSNAQLARVGTALTPNFEKIASLAPTLIVTSDVKGEQLTPLKKLARTVSLPWLTLPEWLTSIEQLGSLVEQKEAGQALSQKLRSQLDLKEPTNAPRVLFSLDYGDTGSNDIWFIRRNSIHGALLRTAGVRNAVERDVTGPPKLSPEQLIELNPDAILVLRSAKPDGADDRIKKNFARWKPLKAVEAKTIGVISIPGSLTVGPRILDLIPRIQTEVKQLIEEPSSD